jgi:hypothetical protein
MSENQTVAAQNKDKIAVTQDGVHANFDNTVDMRDFKFNFRKDELGNKRPSVELKLPVPSVEGIIAILQAGGKQLEFLQEIVADAIAAQARTIIDAKEDISQETFPMNEVTWDFIANIPPKERRGGGIPKETWEAFAKDYVEVMPAVTGKTAEQVGNAGKIFLNKFSAVKTNKPVLKVLKDQLALYAANTPNAETFVDCIEFLGNKVDTLLAADEAALLANL